MSAVVWAHAAWFPSSPADGLIGLFEIRPIPAHPPVSLALRLTLFRRWALAAIRPAASLLACGGRRRGARGGAQRGAFAACCGASQGEGDGRDGGGDQVHHVQLADQDYFFSASTRPRVISRMHDALLARTNLRSKHGIYGARRCEVHSVDISNTSLSFD